MNKGSRLLTLIIGLAIVVPTGYTLGSQAGADEGEGGSGQELVEETYAFVPEASIPDQLVEACEAKVLANGDEDCVLMLEMVELKEDGILDPGEYSREELQEYVETPLP